MGERQGRPVNLVGEQTSGRKFRRRQVRPASCRGGVRDLVIGVVAMLGLAVMSARLARAQETPAKNDAVAKPEAPRQPAGSRRLRKQGPPRP